MNDGEEKWEKQGGEVDSLLMIFGKINRISILQNF